MTRLSWSEIVQQAKKMGVGETQSFETIKLAKAEKATVQGQLQQGFTVEISGDHELTITRG